MICLYECLGGEIDFKSFGAVVAAAVAILLLFFPSAVAVQLINSLIL